MDEVEPVLGRVAELGGEVVAGPIEIPGTSRVGVIRDPTGAQLAVWQPQGFAGAEVVNETGMWTWSDVLTRDPDAASAFYEGLFGWKTERVVDIYASFTLGDLLIGGMRTISPEETTPASWMPYFVVGDADIAAERVEELGGHVLVPPTQVPAGRFVIIADDRGAPSGVVEMGPEAVARGVDGS